MPLTVITGLPGEGKTRALLDIVSREVRRGRDVLVAEASAARARRAAERIASVAPTGVRVSRLSESIESHWALVGDGRRIVSGLMRQVLLERALIAAGVLDHPGRGATELLGTLAERATAIGSTDSMASPLASALRIHRASLQEHGLVEEAEAVRLLAEQRAPASSILVCGFAALPEHHVRMLAAWSRAGCRVFLSLPWREDHAGTAATGAVVDRLAQEGPTVVDVRDDDRPPELDSLREGLFSGRGGCGAEGHVRMAVAQGDEAEGRAVARAVRRALDEGAHPSKVAVALPDPARLQGWLTAAMEAEGVEARFDMALPILQTPLGGAMGRLWSFAAGSRSRDDLSGFIRSPFSGVSRQDAEALDHAWRADRSRSPGRMVSSCGRARGLIERCTRLAGRPVDTGTGRLWKDVADDLLHRAHPGDCPRPDAGTAVDAAVHRAFCRALSDALASPEVAVSAREMWTAFLRGSVAVRSEAEAGVLVTSLQRLDDMPYDAVIIGGLTAGELPRRGGRDPLEGDAVRDVLGWLGLEAGEDLAAADARQSFFLAVASASRRLCLVRRESDDEGRGLRESPYWSGVLDMYRDTGEPPVDIFTADGASRRTGAPRTARGCLSRPDVLAELGGLAAATPSEIELYIACPYRWFVQTRLRPKSIDETVDARLGGRTAHAALADFYVRWQAAGRGRVTVADVEAAAEIAAACAIEAVEAAPAPRSLAEERELTAVVSDVVGLVRRDAVFLPDHSPVHVEWDFGGPDGMDLGGVRLRGRADRVDLGPEGLIVIDYKRGAASPLAVIERERRVQLQLYAAAASLALGVPVAGGLYRSLGAGAEDRGFVLEGTRGRFKPKDVVGRGVIDELIQRAVADAADAFEGMRAGRITPAPDPERCERCTAKPFCQAVER